MKTKSKEARKPKKNKQNKTKHKRKPMNKSMKKWSGTERFQRCRRRNNQSNPATLHSAHFVFIFILFDFIFWWRSSFVFLSVPVPANPVRGCAAIFFPAIFFPPFFWFSSIQKTIKNNEKIKNRNQKKKQQNISSVPAHSIDDQSIDGLIRKWFFFKLNRRWLDFVDTSVSIGLPFIDFTEFYWVLPSFTGFYREWKTFFFFIL